MATRLSSVQNLFPEMRPDLVLLWRNEDRSTRRIELHRTQGSHVLRGTSAAAALCRCVHPMVPWRIFADE